jgi:hypothetical protein
VCWRGVSSGSKVCTTSSRSYTATAARHGHNTLDVLIQAADSRPWIPAT